MKQLSPFKTTLGNYQLTVTPDAHQSHILFRVEVPKLTKELIIHYAYSPTEEKVEANVDKLFLKYQKDNHMASSDRAHIQSVRNLITISARSNKGFEGSCHRFETVGTITINNTSSTPGMNTGEIEPGFWDISFNLHALVTELTQIDCTIQALHEEELNVHQPIAIEDISKKSLERNKMDYRHFQKVELHSHTQHSDAIHTTSELVNEAIKQNIDWLAITDHNTLSAFNELATENKSIKLIKGLEMTTLHGHFLTLGYQDQKPIDWTSIDRFNINAKLKEMKEQNLLIGIAHPFDVGSPYCTGCRWQYVLESLEYIDFIEVWNSEDPHYSLSSADAIGKWTQLLNSGIEIPATCGRDWHHSNTAKMPPSLYVMAEKNARERDILQAIKLGRSYMTIAPQMEWNINNEWTIGDRITSNGVDDMVVNIHLTNAAKVHVVKVESNLGDLVSSDQLNIQYKIDTIKQLKWLRVSAFDNNLNRILLTNPIYFSEN